MSYQVNESIRAALDALADRDEVKRLLDYIREDQDRCIREHIELTCIEAPTFHESKRAERFAQLLRENGMDEVRIDEGGNVVAIRRGLGQGKAVLAEAHLDTVFPFGSVRGVEEKDGLLYAPGISDNTRGLAMLVSMARALNACGIRTRGDLVIAGTTREEGMGDMNGMKHLMADWHDRVKASVSIDSGDMADIIYEATGIRTIEVGFHGIGGHAYLAFGQVANPLHAAARAVAKIADIPVPEDPKTTYCVSNFHAGNDGGIHAIVKDAVIKINYRSTDPQTLEWLEQQIFAAIRSACDEETARWGKDAITWGHKRVVNVPAGTQDAHSPIVQSLHAVIEQLGMRPVIRRGGVTNCSIAIGHGVPAVCISSYDAADGPVNTMDHTLTEKYPIKGAYKGVQLLTLLMLLCAGTENTAATIE